MLCFDPFPSPISKFSVSNTTSHNFNFIRNNQTILNHVYWRLQRYDLSSIPMLNIMLEYTGQQVDIDDNIFTTERRLTKSLRMLFFSFRRTLQLPIFPLPTTVARISNSLRLRCLGLWRAVPNSDHPSLSPELVFPVPFT